MSSQSRWAASASEHRADLPENITLRDYCRGLRSSGAMWVTIGDLVGITAGAAQASVGYAPGKKRKPKQQQTHGGELTVSQKKRIAKAYGVTWGELQEIRAAGLTVAQVKARAGSTNRSRRATWQSI